VIHKFDAGWRMQVAAKSFAPGAVVSEVARRHGIQANLLSFWRLRYGAKARASLSGRQPLCRRHRDQCRRRRRARSPLDPATELKQKRDDRPLHETMNSAFGSKAGVAYPHPMPHNGLEMSRPASQGKYRTFRNAWLAGSAPSSC